MANEFKHKTVGTQLTQAEWEAVGGHVLDSQAAGDIIYASSTSQLSRLGVGTAGKVLMVNSGASAPEWAAAITGITSVLNAALVIGRDADNDIDFATDNNIIFRAAGADQIKLVDGVLQPVTDDDIDLGTSSYAYKDIYLEGDIKFSDAGEIDVAAGDLTVDVEGDIILNANGGDIKFADDSVSLLSITNSSSDAVIKPLTDAKDIIFQQYDGTEVARVEDNGTFNIVTDKLAINGTAITSTAAELNLMDGGTSAGTTAVADGDGIVTNDGGTMRQTTVQTFATYFADEITAMSNLVTVGALDSGSITSGFTSIDVGAGAIAGGSFDASDGNITNVGDISLDSISADGTQIDITLTDNDSTALEIKESTNAYMTFNTTNSSEKIQVHKALDIDAASDFGSNAMTNVNIDSGAIDGITLGTNSAVTQAVIDNININGTTIGHTSDTDLMTLTSGVVTVAGEVSMTTLDIGGTDVTTTAAEINLIDGGTSVGSSITIADSDGFLVNDAGTMKTIPASDIKTYASATATNATHVLVTDNESTNEENLVTFVEGATSSTGNVGLEMDGNLTYNPSSGTLTATAFAGNITGNVTGNASGTALTVTQAAQSSITSLGTLTTLTVDNVIINGTTIGHTSDTDLLTLTSANLAVAGDLEVSGELQIADIGFTDGDNAMTIADGGGVTFAQNAVFSGTIDIGHATDTTLSGSSGVLSVQGTPVRTAGVEHIWVPATAMTPSESNGCGTLTTLETTAGRPDISHLPFDNSADENAQFSISLPKSWDETGDLTCTVYWTSSRDVSNEDVTWAIAPICFGNNDDVDTAFPTPTIITTDTAQGQEFMNITSSVAIDVAGSPAAGDLCFFEISRDVSDTDGTTLAADALLIGVKIFYTTNAATDA